MCPRPHLTDKKYSFAKFERICWRYVVTMTCLTYLSLAFWKVTSAFSASVHRLASCDSYSCIHKTSSWTTSCNNTHTKLSILILLSFTSNFSHLNQKKYVLIFIPLRNIDKILPLWLRLQVPFRFGCCHLILFYIKVFSDILHL